MVSSIKLSKPINGKPVFDGEYKPSNLDKIFDDIVLRKDEIYPPNTENYIEADWEHYHDSVVLEKFPSLVFVVELVKDCLESIDVDWSDYYFKSWINIWPKAQSIGIHNHNGDWHGNYVINDTGTSTFYMDDETKEVREFKNYNGHFIMMDSDVKHWASHNPKNQFRVSTAFNLMKEEDLRDEERKVSIKMKKILDKYSEKALY
jgi:hypothetical protein|tara:strand:+ start:670 stop:1281 length:612 start_codon:yes stop_codon:yes gene_type:complete